MDINQTSTAMSTNLVSQLEQELTIARQVGARKETVAAIEQRLLKEKGAIEKEQKYRDIQSITEWPTEILLKTYHKTAAKAKELFDQVGKLTLLDQQENQPLIAEYDEIIKRVEVLEDEGRRRELVAFMPEEEIRACLECSDDDKNLPPPVTVANKQGGNV